MFDLIVHYAAAYYVNKLIPMFVIHILMGQCKKNVTPLLMYWSYISLALTHWYNLPSVERSRQIQVFVSASRSVSICALNNIPSFCVNLYMVWLTLLWPDRCTMVRYISAKIGNGSESTLYRGTLYWLLCVWGCGKHHLPWALNYWMSFSYCHLHYSLSHWIFLFLRDRLDVQKL